MAASRKSIWAMGEDGAQQEAVLRLQTPFERAFELRDLSAQSAACLLGKDGHIFFAADERLQHLARALAQYISGHCR